VCDRACCACSHCVAAKGQHLAFVSTTVETDRPEQELAPGLALLGPIQEKFVVVSDVHKPLGDGSADACYISRGYDASSHFESTIDDVLAMYERITGEALDVSSPMVEGLQET
jgi:Rab GDP dissociation inhibitor